MKVLIVVATAGEAARLVDLPAHVEVSGVGPVAAALATQRALAREPFDLAVSAGIGGAYPGSVPEDSTVTARVGLQRNGLAFALDVELEGHFPGLSSEQAHALMHAAHQVCPYSVALRDNVAVRLKVAD